MLKNNRNTFIVILFFSILSCGGPKPFDELQQIPVLLNSFDQLSISDISSDIVQVTLETKEESFIGNIIKVERTADYIFVLETNESNRVLQFDAKGSFIQEVGIKGNGPEEYERLLTFTIDKRSKHIYLVTLMKIVRYDFENNFIDYFAGLTFPEYAHFNNGHLQIYLTKEEAPSSGEGYDRRSWRYEIQNNNLITDSIETKHIHLNRQIYTIFPKAKYLSSTTTTEYYYQPVLAPEEKLRDTLYQLINNQLRPHLKLSFKGTLINQANEQALKIKSITRSDRYLFSEYLYEGEKLFIYDFENQKGYNLKVGINGEELTNGETIEIAPLVNEPNVYYFNTYIWDDETDYDPNPTIFFVNLKRTK